MPERSDAGGLGSLQGLGEGEGRGGPPQPLSVLLERRHPCWVEVTAAGGQALRRAVAEGPPPEGAPGCLTFWGRGCQLCRRGQVPVPLGGRTRTLPEKGVSPHSWCLGHDVYVTHWGHLARGCKFAWSLPTARASAGSCCDSTVTARKRSVRCSGSLGHALL